MTSKASKQYGLILPKKDQKKLVLVSKPSIFDEDSDESEEKTIEKSIKNQGLKNLQKRQTQLEMQRALEEDPTVYEYDSVFDSMQRKKEILKTVQTKDKTPKYINSLLKSAEQRKKDYERRIERKIQKEREEEGTEFADKDAFVTTAYKKKMLEMQEEEEKERKQNDIDARNDVMKQEDLSSFYRHMLKEKVGEAHADQPQGPVQVKQEKTEDKVVPGPSGESLDDAALEALRKHRSQAPKPIEIPLHHPTADVDSEFSVDSESSSSETGEDGETDKNQGAGVKRRGRKHRHRKRTSTDKAVSSSENKKKRTVENNEGVDPSESNKVGELQSSREENEIQDKENIADSKIVSIKKEGEEKVISTAERIRNLFKKRNVGEVYEAAKERYLARKNARETARNVFK